MIICMIVASVLFVIFAFLFLTADASITAALVTCCIETQNETIKKTQIEMNLLVQEMKRSGMPEDKPRRKKGRQLKRKQEEAQAQLSRLKSGKINVLDIIPVVGYRLVQLMGWDSTNDMVKKLNQQCMQFKEKKEAINYTYYLIASLFGYLLLGGIALFSGIGLGMSMGMGTRSLILGVGAFVMFTLLGYLPYDSVSVIIRKREEDIDRQFPQVMSKLALLTVAGMEVSRAWKLAAASGTGTLYEEMNRVLIDFDNNVSPTEAYSKFIVRCNNRYATKLATAIIQNISKGNSEIAALFRRLNDESWMEHKHNARRMGEKIQSKLFLPTMLMFGGIIVLIIVPVMSGFNF